MNRENKKEKIAELNRQGILSAAEKLFTKKGFAGTTIDDISRESEYSRRTIYSYFKNKEAIMQHIVFNGLDELRTNLSSALRENSHFLERYEALCEALTEYQMNNPHSSFQVNSFKAEKTVFENIPEVIRKIFLCGTEINKLLEDFIEEGKVEGVVLSSVNSEMTVMIMWSGITSLIDMVSNKEQFITEKFDVSPEEFLKYGFNQIINSILEVRI